MVLGGAAAVLRKLTFCFAGSERCPNDRQGRQREGVTGGDCLAAEVMKVGGQSGRYDRSTL